MTFPGAFGRFSPSPSLLQKGSFGTWNVISVEAWLAVKHMGAQRSTYLLGCGKLDMLNTYLLGSMYGRFECYT